MAQKRVANKVTLWGDPAIDGNLVQYGCLQSIDAPGQTKDPIDLTCLEDDYDDNQPSPVVTLEQCTFVLYRDPVDTDHQQLDTIFARKADDTPSAIIPWLIKVPFDGSNYQYAFNGWIQSLGPVAYTVKGEVVQEITIELTTAAVFSTDPPPPPA